MRKVLRLALLAVGISAAAYLFVRHAGPIGQSLGQVGPWGVLLYLAASFAKYGFDTLGWRMLFLREMPPVSFGRLYSVRAAGEAVNKVTPLASLGGEPLKGYLLTRDGSPLREALASVAIAKNAATLAQIGFIWAGILVALPLLPGKAVLLVSLGLFPACIFAAIGVTALLDLRLRRMRGGWDTGPGEGEGRVRGRLGRAFRKAAVTLWSQVADFYWANPARSLAGIGLFVLGWAAGALELLAGSAALGAPLTVRDALLLESMLVAVNMATFFIPANAGSQEGGFTFLAPLVGLGAGTALALAVLRRCRDVVWIGYGLLYLAVTEGRVLVRPPLEAPEGAE